MATADLRLGQVVHVRTSRKGADAAFVVTSEPGPRDGVVWLAYCGSRRWYKPQRYGLSQVNDDLLDNEHVRRARRWLTEVTPDLDGWLRITVGRPPHVQMATVGHAALQAAR